MSVVIVGGHDRMVSQYVKICKSFNCKAKVFTQMTADFGKQIGAPDLFKGEATAKSVTGHVCVNSNSVGFWKR